MCFEAVRAAGSFGAIVRPLSNSIERTQKTIFAPKMQLFQLFRMFNKMIFIRSKLTELKFTANMQEKLRNVFEVCFSKLKITKSPLYF